MGNEIDQGTTSVIGLLFPGGRRQYIELDCLEDLFNHLVEQDPECRAERLPYYVVLKDGTTFPYIHYFFYEAFVKGTYSEQELREISIYSGI